MSDNRERKEIYGHIYGLYRFDREGRCKHCGATDRTLNKVGHCETCQDELDLKAGVKRKCALQVSLPFARRRAGAANEK
jgi:hypothetical protein